MTVAIVATLALLLAAPVVHFHPRESCRLVAQPVDATTPTAQGSPAATTDVARFHSPWPGQPTTLVESCSQVQPDPQGVVAALGEHAAVDVGATLRTAIPLVALAGLMLAIASIALADPQRPPRVKHPATPGRVAFTFVGTFPLLGVYYSPHLGLADRHLAAFAVDITLLPFAVVDAAVQGLVTSLAAALLGAYGFTDSLVVATSTDPMGWPVSLWLPDWTGKLGTPLAILATASLWWWLQPRLAAMWRARAAQRRHGSRTPAAMQGMVAVLAVTAGLAGCLGDPGPEPASTTASASTAPSSVATATGTPSTPTQAPATGGSNHSLPMPVTSGEGSVVDEQDGLRLSVQTVAAGPDRWRWDIEVAYAPTVRDHLLVHGLCGTPITVRLRLADGGGTPLDGCTQTLDRWTPTPARSWSLGLWWNGTDQGAPAYPGTHRLEVTASVLLSRSPEATDHTGRPIARVASEVATTTPSGTPRLLLSWDTDEAATKPLAGRFIVHNVGDGWAYHSAPSSCESPIDVAASGPNGAPVAIRPSPQACLAIVGQTRIAPGGTWAKTFSWDGTWYGPDGTEERAPAPSGTYGFLATLRMGSAPPGGGAGATQQATLELMATLP